MRKSFNTTLETDLILKLKTAALEQNRGANDILEELLKEYFKKEKKENKND